MPVIVIEHLRKKVRQMGLWAGTRYLRNQGFSFEAAHFIVLGVMPRKG